MTRYALKLNTLQGGSSRLMEDQFQKLHTEDTLMYQCKDLWLLVFLWTNTNVVACQDISIHKREAAISLSHAIFGRVNECLVIHDVDVAMARLLGNMNQQVMTVNVSTLDKHSIHFLATWLKREAWCAVSFIHKIESLKATGDIVRPVSNRLVVVLGNLTEKMSIHDSSLTDTRIVWLEQVTSDQLYLHVKCPTVTPAPWSFHDNINLWRGRHGSFAIRQPAVICCKNPMFGQSLTMLHSRGARQTIYSELTGEPIGGRIYQLFKLFSEVYEFSLKTQLSLQGTFHLSNMSFDGMFGSVINGSGFGVINLWMHLPWLFMDLTNPHDINEQVFFSRRPIPVDTYNNLIKPFSPGVWALSCLSLFALGVMLFTTHKSYAGNSYSQHLIKKETSTMNFALYPFVKITEPEALPWFSHGWSTGKILTFQWTMLSAFLVMFYTCNLLAYMTAVDLEKPLDSLQDIVDLGKTPYIFTSSVAFNKPYLEAIGKKDSIHYKIADLAEGKGGFIDFTEFQDRDTEKQMQDILVHRASQLNVLNNLPLVFIDTNRRLTRQDIHVGKEVAASAYECLALKKHSPATQYLNQVIQKVVESGLSYKYLTELSPVEEIKDMKTVNLPFALTIKTLSLSLFMLAFGLVVAFIVYLTETGGSRSRATEKDLTYMDKNLMPWT